MLDVFRNILKFLSHHTYGEFLNRLWYVAVKPLYESSARYIVKLELKSVLDPDPSLNIKELAFADVEMMSKVMYVSRAGLQERFLHGDRCFAVINNNKIISYFWAQFGFRNFRELHLKFKLPSNWAWMYNAITVKAARGQGLYPNIIRYMAKTLIQSRIDECFIDVAPKNLPSVRGLDKAGATRVVLIKMKKIFSTVSYNITVFDEDAWQKLSSTIENFDQIQCAKKDGKCL